MKKIYMIPTVEVMKLAPATMIAESLPKDPTPIDPEEFEIKEERSGRGAGSVWDDDWSN